MRTGVKEALTRAALQTMLNAAAGASLNVAAGVRIVLTPGRQYRVNGQLTFSPSGINGRFQMFCYGSRIAYGAPAGSRETLSSVTFDATAKTLTRLDGTWALARYPTGRWIDVRGTANVDGQYKVVSGQDTAVLTVQEGFNPHMLANETVKCTIDCSVSCLELGDANHKWFDSVIEGLYMTRVGEVANATNGIKIRNADFFTIRNCTISVADRSLYAAGLLEDGGNNSLTLDTVNMGAGRVCFQGQANVLSIKGATRWQQSQCGMRLFESSVFDIGVIDFSLCTIRPGGSEG